MKQMKCDGFSGGRECVVWGEGKEVIFENVKDRYQMKEWKFDEMTMDGWMDGWIDRWSEREK